jgi:hypothetical protein
VAEKQGQKILRKTTKNTRKGLDPKMDRAHIDEGSKRFEEQQASEKVANRER